MLPLLLPMSDGPKRDRLDSNQEPMFVSSRCGRKAFKIFRIGLGSKPSNPEFQSAEIKDNAARSITTKSEYPSRKPNWQVPFL